jgi:hypothetical protein
VFKLENASASGRKVGNLNEIIHIWYHSFFNSRSTGQPYASITAPLCNLSSLTLLRSCQSLSHARDFQHFMEPEVSLPCSQEPAPCLCSEPDEYNAPPHTICLRSSLTLSHLRLRLLSGLFPSGFPTKTQYARLCNLWYMLYPVHPPRLDHFNYV